MLHKTRVATSLPPSSSFWDLYLFCLLTWDFLSSMAMGNSFFVLVSLCVALASRGWQATWLRMAFRVGIGTYEAGFGAQSGNFFFFAYFSKRWILCLVLHSVSMILDNLILQTSTSQCADFSFIVYSRSAVLTADPRSRCG